MRSNQVVDLFLQIYYQVSYRVSTLSSVSTSELRIEVGSGERNEDEAIDLVVAGVKKISHVLSHQNKSTSCAW